MRLEWKDTYSVGIKSIDGQHKKIVDYINQLDELINEKYDENKVRELFMNFVKYTKSHLQHEEKLFDVYEYPLGSEHKTQHNKFINIVAELDTLQPKEIKDRLPGLLEFLVSWLIDHILIEDKKYQDHFTRAGVI